MTNGEFVARIVNNGRLLTKDETISRRFVLSIGRAKAKTYMSHKLADNTLFEESNTVTHIDCLQLKEADYISCGLPQLRGCKHLYKSVEKLPELLSSRWGDSIVYVNSIDNTKKLDKLNIARYASMRKRRYADKFGKGYYYVKDGYLYVVDVKLLAVNVGLITLLPEEAEGMSECSACDSCKSLWEYDFICSDKLLETVSNETITEVMQYYRRIQPDENPNLSENQRDRTE